MSFTSYLWVKSESKQKNRLLLKCFKSKIPIYETKEENGYFYLKILENDYPKIKKFWFVKITKENVTGPKQLKQEIRRHHIFLIGILFGLILLYFLSHVMVSVEVIHSNSEIRNLVSLSLEEKGIKKNSWRKEYQEIEKIKAELLNEYPNQLEWIEIEVKGMKYIVRVEERKIETPTPPKKSCHIVANKDALVKKMIYSSGEALVKMNDSVKKGDILISGIIKKEEEEKGVVCATGEVYGEVWYQVTASVPLEYETITRTNKKRWNIRYRNSYYDDFIFKSRLDSYEEERTHLFSILGQEVSFVVQYETRKTKKVYTESEAKDIAVSSALEKINATLSEKERIIDKKVLKKEVNNSTMNVEIFVSVLESIGESQEFIKEENKEKE